MRRKPRIAVTGPRWGGRMLTWLNCLAVWRAGGCPQIVTPGWRARLAHADALVIGGGEDIDAVLYDDKLRLRAKPDRERDRLELEALELAERKNLPVLGICRGAQLINVFRGGTLNPDSYGAWGGAGRQRSLWPRKKITLSETSRLFKLMDCDVQRRVNCLHHQSIERLGAGLQVSAQDTLGLVQGIELESDRFLVGVQWHPEILFWRRDQLNLFRGVVEAV